MVEAGGHSSQQHQALLVELVLFIFKNCLFIYVAALGLYCFAQASSSFSERGLLLVVVHGLLTAVASRYRAQVLGHTDLSSCSSRAH